jgi:hypothetical protein
MITSAAESANLNGSYAGQCVGKVQCAVEISDQTKVAIIVADRLDYDKKICIVAGELHHVANGLAGEIKNGWKLSVVPTPDGGLYLNGLPKQACSMNLNGYYGAIGD